MKMNNHQDFQAVFDWETVNFGDLLLVQTSSREYHVYGLQYSNTRYEKINNIDIGYKKGRSTIHAFDIVTYLDKSVSDYYVEHSLNFLAAVIHAKFGIIGIPSSKLAKIL